MVICPEQGAGLHTAQLMPLPLTVCCSSKIHIGFTFLVPAHLGSPGQRTVKRMYSMYVCTMTKDTLFSDFLKSYCAVHNCCEWLIGISAKRTSTRGIVGCRLVLAGCWSESQTRAVPVWHHSQNPKTVHCHNGYYIFHLLYINFLVLPWKFPKLVPCFIKTRKLQMCTLRLFVDFLYTNY